MILATLVDESGYSWVDYEEAAKTGWVAVTVYSSGDFPYPKAKHVGDFQQVSRKVMPIARARDDCAERRSQGWKVPA